MKSPRSRTSLSPEPVGIGREPRRQRLRGELALVLPVALAVELIGVGAGAGAALRLQVVDDRGELAAVAISLKVTASAVRLVLTPLKTWPTVLWAISSPRPRPGRSLSFSISMVVPAVIWTTLGLVDEADRDGVAADELLARIDPGIGAAPKRR